jgi:hypothetical protein
MIRHVSKNARRVGRPSVPDCQRSVKSVVEVASTVVSYDVYEGQRHPKLNAHKCRVENTTAEALQVQAARFQDHGIWAVEDLKILSLRGQGETNWHQHIH